MGVPFLCRKFMNKLINAKEIKENASLLLKHLEKLLADFEGQ